MAPEQTPAAVRLANAEIVRRANEAFNRGDIEGYLALCDPGVVYREAASDRALDLPVVIEGHEGLRRAGAEWTETFESFRFDIEELVEVPDGRVVVIGCWRGTAKGSGVEVELPEAHVWTLRDGKLAESQAYVSRAEAYRAVGHSADEA